MAKNPIEQAIQDIANRTINSKHFETPAKVLKFDFEKYYADVELINKDSGKKGIIEKVPITFGTLGGVDGTTIEEGDLVMVSFINGKGSDPKITRIITRDYDEEVREVMKAEEGAYVPDSNVVFV
jgi:hypothetical protein